MSFYNTTSETGATLAHYKLKEAKQREYVLGLFKRLQIPLTPSFVHESYCRDTGKHRTPLTSIRRTITDLTADNKLERLDDKTEGIYGRNQHYWKLKEVSEPGQQKLF